jgi:hypothetical protein
MWISLALVWDVTDSIVVGSVAADDLGDKPESAVVGGDVIEVMTVRSGSSGVAAVGEWKRY